MCCTPRRDRAELKEWGTLYACRGHAGVFLGVACGCTLLIFIAFVTYFMVPAVHSAFRHPAEAGPRVKFLVVRGQGFP